MQYLVQCSAAVHCPLWKNLLSGCNIACVQEPVWPFSSTVQFGWYFWYIFGWGSGVYYYYKIDMCQQRIGSFPTCHQKLVHMTLESLGLLLWAILINHQSCSVALHHYPEEMKQMNKSSRHYRTVNITQPLL